MPLRPSDFSDELQAILGSKAAPHDTTNRQKVCTTDPRITPQVYLEDQVLDGHVPPQDATAKPVTETPIRIRHAHRGDILVSPGGPSGMIGALLAALTPPQDYSHCGLILDDDGTTVRHCTTLDDHVELFPQGSIAGIDVPLPVDGFKESAVRFGWPGTLTQRIEDAVVLSRVTRKKDREASPALNALAIRDPDGPDSSDNKMWVSALSFDPSAVPYKDADGTDQWKVVWPMLVKPCLNGVDDATARDVLTTLDRVATAAEGLRGHYRTYTYTDAIARSGPPMKVDKPLESDATVPAPGAACNGAGGNRVSPTTTFGYQCSSFIWNAVQAANSTRPPGTRRILLDGRPDHLEPSAECVRTSDLIRKRYGDDRFDPATVDGLYLYPEAFRKDAAVALQAKIRQKVIDRIDKMLPLWLRAAGAAGVDMTTTQILALASAGPLLGLANALGVSTLFLNDLITFITNAPDKIANQVGSAFAFDDSSTAANDRTRLAHPPRRRTYGESGRHHPQLVRTNTTFASACGGKPAGALRAQHPRPGRPTHAPACSDSAGHLANLAGIRPVSRARVLSPAGPQRCLGESADASCTDYARRHVDRCRQPGQLLRRAGALRSLLAGCGIRRHSHWAHVRLPRRRGRGSAKRATHPRHRA
jgi:hypothetical protein